VDIHKKEYDDLKSPIFAAIQDPRTREKKMPTVKWLLDHGADPNQTCYWMNGTPLQTAVRHKELEIAELLLEAGADPNLVIKEGRRRRGIGPVLLYVAKNGWVGLMRQLFRRGADPRVFRQHRTVIEYAQDGGILDKTREMLIEFGWEELFEKWLLEYRRPAGLPIVDKL
jgi:ankyrin repeat protein